MDLWQVFAPVRTPPVGNLLFLGADWSGQERRAWSKPGPIPRMSNWVVRKRPWTGSAHLDSTFHPSCRLVLQAVPMLANTMPSKFFSQIILKKSLP